MVTVSGTMLVVMLASVAALAAADGDHGLGRDDIERKQAYAAAEAGIADYVQDLNSDNAYWAKCTNVPSPNAVNQRWNGTGAGHPHALAQRCPAGCGRAADEQRSSTRSSCCPPTATRSCNETNAAGTMLDSATGTFRIRSTGRIRQPDSVCTAAPPCYEKRSLIAQFRRRGFLDYLYFTDFETSDPAWYAQGHARAAPPTPTSSAGRPPHCAQYWRDGRGSQRYYDPNGDGNQDGQIFSNGQWQDYSLLPCTSIQFADGDCIRGPLHTNDDILVCGTPNFGRGAAGRDRGLGAPARAAAPTAAAAASPSSSTARSGSRTRRSSRCRRRTPR